MLQSMGSQTLRHNLAIEQQQQIVFTEKKKSIYISRPGKFKPVLFKSQLNRRFVN